MPNDFRALKSRLYLFVHPTISEENHPLCDTTKRIRGLPRSNLQGQPGNQWSKVVGITAWRSRSYPLKTDSKTNVVMLQENISNGQRVEKFKVFAYSDSSFTAQVVTGNGLPPTDSPDDFFLFIRAHERWKKMFHFHELFLQSDTNIFKIHIFKFSDKGRLYQKDFSLSDRRKIHK